jgi:glycosyltransferase involved in cell wall biosynthesis
VTNPRVSLLLVVKDGMPYLREAVDSVRRQTFRDFEVVVQDGGSTDGSAEYLAGITDIPNWSSVSEADSGIGEAYNRAVRRSTGAIVGSIDSDNVLEPDALERVVGVLAEHPELAAVYGGSNMLAADGSLLYPWMPAEFDLLRLIECELVPPFAVSFFVRDQCEDLLAFDESLKTCADFDLWLRLSHLPIARVSCILGGTRLSERSMTRRPETYEQCLIDKGSALNRYLSTLPAGQLVEAVRRRARAGLHLWAADSVYDIEARRTPQFERYLQVAKDADPGSAWLERTAAKPELAPATLPAGSDAAGEAAEPSEPASPGRLSARARRLGDRLRST